MESVTFSRSVPIVAQTEVLVVGGGPAGIAAAIAASRIGARTLLVERYGFLGGTATAALVGPFMTCYSLDGSIQLVRGVFDELVRRMEAIGGATHPSKTAPNTPQSSYLTIGHHHVTPFNPDAFKLVAAEMCLEAGVQLLFHSCMVEPIVEGSAVRGVIVHNKSGLQAIRTVQTVDCTGDGDVAFHAGAEMVKGRPEDGLMQPASLFFRVRNVDRTRIDEYRRAHPTEQRLFEEILTPARANGEFLVQRVCLNAYMENDNETWRMNITRVLGVDGTDAKDVTRAEIEARRQVHYLMDYFRRCLPGFEDAVLVETGTQVGFRETRRLVGEYVLTIDDLAKGVVFPDSIGFAGFPVDIHQVDGDGGTVVGFGPRGKFPVADVYAIPLRSLIPRRVDNLLVAGRCISVDHLALGAVRVMPPCFETGQAAGVAAALAAQLGVTPRSLPASAVQNHLALQGAYLEPLNLAVS